MTPADVDRFWSKVDKSGGPDACWPYNGSRCPKGYGTVAIDGGTRKAHRLAWSIAHGPIPAGLHVCHHCDSPPCCNPTHLWTGTNAENNADMMAKGRHVAPTGDRHGARLHPERLARGEEHSRRMREVAARGARNGARLYPELMPRGERNGRAKLTEAQVLSIRERYASGLANQTALAVEYRVSQTVISAIVRGETWGHVAGPLKVEVAR